MKKSPQIIAKINSERLLLGVTGSMGCGKTYTCYRLESIAKTWGVQTSYISVDEVRREILGEHSKFADIRRQLAESFGEKILKAVGAVCGRKLGNIIFNNKSAMRRYKQIVYPELKRQLRTRIKKVKGLILLEWALLAEDGLLSLVDGNALVVTCDYQTQLQRLLGDDLPDEQVKKRIASQASNSEKTNPIADYQIRNTSGNLYILDNSTAIANQRYQLLLVKILGDLLCQKNYATKNKKTSVFASFVSRKKVEGCCGR